MNLLQQAVAAFREALGPVLLAGQDPFARRAVLESLRLTSAAEASFPQIDVAGLDSTVQTFLDKSEPDFTDFLSAASKIVDEIKNVHTWVTTFSNGDYEAGTSALAIAWLKFRHPIVYCAARMVGLIEWNVDQVSTQKLRLDRVGDLVTDLPGYFHAIYPLQSESDAKKVSDTIFVPLALATSLLGKSLVRRGMHLFPPTYGSDAPEDTNAPIGDAISRRTLTFPLAAEINQNVQTTALVTAAFIPAEHGGPGMLIRFAGAKAQAPLGKNWTIGVDFGSVPALALLWKFDGTIQTHLNADSNVVAAITRSASAARMRFPITTNTRLEIGDLDFRFTANVREIDAALSIHHAALGVGRDSADSFVATAMPSNGLRGEFDLQIGMSSRRGFYIGGTAGIVATFPMHTTIGPVRLDQLTLELKPDSQQSGLALVGSLALSVTIGPVIAVVEGIGAQIDLTFSSTDANLGILNLNASFKPPNGIGVSIDAGPISGGGFIYLDPPAGRYAGVLQLKIKDLAIKAIGILDTKLPSGGYSFLIIISAEFAPIQLAMGFTLNGVGGLAGLHRTTAVAELQAGIRSHATDDVLFPNDPVKNAPRIISDLRRFFPPQKGRYLFGPMALIGWGTPTLLKVKLGIILDLPAPLRIILLGQLDCSLPDASAVIDLHVDVLGVLDFGERSFSLDGTIHDSRIGPYSLYGDFAVRMRWGNAPQFALSIGGFHPHFRQIPAGFPSLRRITLALSNGDNPRLTLQCYVALTSNSLQFGSRAELYASASGFSVSGWIGFDVLIIFHPFGFEADLSAGFVLRRGSKNLGGIQVSATLTGPSPWHVWGEASISVLFFDVTVSFDVTIGESGPGALPSIDVWPQLKAALEAAEHWSGVLPPAAAQVVTLKKPELGVLPLLDPVGTITLVERVAPLAHRITRFADAQPSGANRFDLTNVDAGDEHSVAHDYTYELFAPAQFESLSDDEKLSRPSFERMAAGMALDDRVVFGTATSIVLTCKTIVIDKPWASHDAVDYTMAAEVQVALADCASNATGGSRDASERYVTPGAKAQVTLDDERYVVAAFDDLTVRSDITPAGTKGAVVSALSDYLVTHASERGSLIIISELEALAA